MGLSVLARLLICVVLSNALLVIGHPVIHSLLGDDDDVDGDVETDNEEALPQPRKSKRHFIVDNIYLQIIQLFINLTNERVCVCI
jgi:hypothetical protein